MIRYHRSDKDPRTENKNKEISKYCNNPPLLSLGCHHQRTRAIFSGPVVLTNGMWWLPIVKNHTLYRRCKNRFEHKFGKILWRRQPPSILHFWKIPAEQCYLYDLCRFAENLDLTVRIYVRNSERKSAISMT